MSKFENLKVIIESKINKNNNYKNLIMIAIIVVLLITNWTSCEKNIESKKVHIQNVEAIKKQIVVEKNKNNEMQSSIVAYKGTVKTLNEYSQELEGEVKKLKNRKPIVVTKFKTLYRVDTFYVTNTILDTFGLNKNQYRLSWKYSNLDSTRMLEGNSLFDVELNYGNLKIKPGLTSITKDELFLDFTVGVVKNKKTKYEEIFVTPKNPNITIRNLEGAIIKKTKLGINLSFNVGYGVHYGSNNFGLGPFAGLSISKPIIKF